MASLTETLRIYLREVTTLSLATVDAAGLPHAANLYFAPDDDLNLYFVSDPKSAHCQHLLTQPNVAATVYAPVRMWQQIRGVQLHGCAAAIDPGQWAIIWQIYLRKFPHIADVEALVRSQTFYRITPRWFRYIDNTIHFGHREETA